MAKAIKYCEIHPDKVCDNCNECNICDLDPNKICDNCGKCIGLTGDTDYLEVDVDGVIDEEWEAEEYLSEEWPVGSFDNENDEVQDHEFDYIEDIPELKQEYDEKIYKILHNKKESRTNSKGASKHEK